ncbi:MAG: argininosuccinate lyase, partial [Chloroflexota bacterium]
GDEGFDVAVEDIHGAVETRLRDKIGDLAGKLHTARSRNDQVALDSRLYLKQATRDTVDAIVGLQRALVELAAANFEVILPGYTHLQRGQPILLAHHLLAYVEMLDRDVDRFQSCYRRSDVMPLGAGALAGVPYPIDPEYVARQLGFDRIARNSIDAVSDRDFVVDYLGAASLAMMHLSRLAEEFVLWSSSEFGFVELDDAYSTGSSIMPQKKNPDVAELVRGKTGRVYGHLVAVLVMMKGLPLAYNKDMQEDKEALFDSVDTLLMSLAALTGMVSTATVRAPRMLAAVDESFALATDLADYLVRKGMPFRGAHEVVGSLVKWCAANGRALTSLSIEDYRRFSPLFEHDVLSISVQASVAARNSPGGTSPERVREAINDARQRIAETSEWVANLDSWATEGALGS